MDQDINSTMNINTENASELSTENVTDLGLANESTAVVEQGEDKNLIKNDKKLIKNVKSKNLKDAPMTKSKTLKKRKETHPPTSEMVMTSIKSLKKYKGASLKDISKYMEDNYGANTKRLKIHINRFLEKSVDNDILEKVRGAADEERFKIKKSNKAKKDARNLLPNDKKKKPVKNMTKSKVHAKK